MTTFGGMNADWAEAKFIVRNLSLKRLRNGVVTLFEYYFSRWRKKPGHSTLPIALSIEPTTACNLGCPECPSGLKKFSRPTGNLKSELLKSILDEIGDSLLYLTFYFQGEPFIHPQITEMIKESSMRGIFTATSTNAHFLDEKTSQDIVNSGLNRLIISIDGTTQEVYQSYRKKGSLEKVVKGTQNILKARNEMGSAFPRVYFQFLVVKPNQHQIEDVKKLARDLGVDGVHFKTAQVYEYENGNELIPTIEKYSRYKEGKDGKWRIKNVLTNQCWKMWHSCVVTWDGKVVPCCFDKDATHALGSFTKKPFKEIWHGPEYANFRGAILRSRSEIDICRNCSEGTKVWV